MTNILGKGSLAAAFILAGSSVVGLKTLAGRLGPFTIISVSLFLSLLAAAPLYRREVGRAIAALDRQGWIMLGLQALMGLFLFRVLLLAGLRYTSAGEAGLLIGATPVITAGLACLLLKERLTMKSVVGILCTTAGIMGLQDWRAVTYSWSHMLGNGLVLGAAACEATFNILSRRESLQKTSDKISPMARTLLVCSLVLVPSLVLALLEKPVAALGALDFSGFLALIWLALFVTVVAYYLWFIGIRHCEASTAAAFSGLMPLASVALSVVVLGESPTDRIVWGGIAIIAGVMVIGFRQSSPPPDKKPIDTSRMPKA